MGGCSGGFCGGSGGGCTVTSEMEIQRKNKVRWKRLGVAFNSQLLRMWPFWYLRPFHFPDPCLPERVWCL
jgi:hypothetical protein